MKPIDLTERLGRWSSGRGPLYVLLAARLRQLIDDGELPSGVTLPPDRALAAELAVGRSTVVAAYDLLHSEGRIVRRQGSGTRVAGHASGSGPDTTGAPVFLSLLEPDDDVISLACAAPDRPPPELVEAYERIVPDLSATTDDIGYHPAGHIALRSAIADRYARRGAPTNPDQIMITGGGQQALSLLARAFVRPGDPVFVEAPTYPGALEAFREAAGVLHPLPIGLAGFEDAARLRLPALAYVIPTYHNPTGSVLEALPLRRLAETANAAGVPLIDDEVPVDLGFPGEETQTPMAAHADTVISVGSLSKIAWGGLRVGWVRAPEPIIGRLARLRAVHDLGGNIPAQLAAADLMPRLEPVLERAARDRLARHDHLRDELLHLLPEWEIPPVRGGQALWVRLPSGDAASFAQTALRHRVAVLPGDGLDASGGSADRLRIHFMRPSEELSDAARRLASAWRAYRPIGRPNPPAAMLAI